MYIAVDFDGTCVSHDYPLIGKDIGSAPVLKKLVAAGHKLILFTMRSNLGLKDAQDWFAENEIPLFGVQENPTQKEWTSSPKCYAHLYIDDAALGCPLVYGDHSRPYADWKEIDAYLELRNLFETKL